MTDEEYAEIQAKTKIAKDIFGESGDFNQATLEMLKDEFDRVSNLAPSKEPSQKALDLAEKLVEELVMYQFKSGDEGEFVKAGLLVEKKGFFIRQLAKCYETDLGSDVE